MTVNNIGVTNTCTCTDVFTVITTKDQSGGIYNSYSTGGQGFMAVNRVSPRDEVCLLQPCEIDNNFAISPEDTTENFQLDLLHER